MQLDGIIRGNDNAAAVLKIDDYFHGLVKPRTFAGPASVEVAHAKQFEEVCLLIQKETGAAVSASTTVLQFYTAVEYIKKQYKSKK